MKIKNLIIRNFKAFYGEYEFNFEGKNILLYGENGSGKSSIYWALYHLFYSFDKIQNIKKYKNIYTNEDISLELEFDDNEKIEYKDNELLFSEDLKEILEKLKKVKLFLSYNDIFLLNELFDKNISLDKFISILKSLYSESINSLLDSYKHTKQNFKNIYLDKKCDIEKQLLDFRERYKEENLLDNYINFQSQYEDIERYDKEGDFIGYDTIYYYSDNVISEYENFLEALKFLNEELEFNSDTLKSIIFELEDIKEYINEKSKESIKERFAIDYEEIETIDILEDLKSNLAFIKEIVDSYKGYENIVNNLNETIISKLLEQLNKINEIIKREFKLNLEIELRQDSFFIADYNDLDKFFPIKYKIKVNELSPTYNHLKFLNEAKISSINFAFYLSIILSYAKLEELKVIILDDLLISLDMSNRDVILDMLLKYFSDYQLIILTHDKAFFEMAKQKFDYKTPNQWKYFEMYVDNRKEFEKPLVLPHRDYFQKAEYYFAKYDYSACANYLRKEAERLLKNLVCNDLNCEEVSSLQEMINKVKSKKNLDSNNKKQIISRIERLVQNENFRSFDKNKLSSNEDKRIIGEIQTELTRIERLFDNSEEDFNDILNMLEQFKSIILNPQSHDDITKPLYKKELEEAIKIIEELKIIIEDKTK